MSLSEPALQIYLFGCPKVTRASDASSHGLGRPLRLLMACLLMDGQRAHHREALAGKIWPMAPQAAAAKSFRTALWRLRGILEPRGTTKGSYLVVAPNGEVTFNWDGDFRADVVEFERSVTTFERSAEPLTDRSDIHALKSALELYDGELLEGSWDDWVIRERERLRRLYLRGLNLLLESQSRAGNYNDALRIGRRILALDPLRESTHRRMLKLYGLSGQRAEAVRHYAALSDDLRVELDVQPAEATRRVFEAVVERSAPDNCPLSLATGEIDTALRQFASCLDDIESSRKRLRKILDSLTNIRG